MALDLTPVAVTGTWWRHLPAGGDPAYRAAVPASGRWQRGEIVAALYLAGDPETVWAEWYRRLAEDAIAPLDALPRDLWRFAVTLGRVAALDTPDRLAASGCRHRRRRAASGPPFRPSASTSGARATAVCCSLPRRGRRARAVRVPPRRGAARHAPATAAGTPGGATDPAPGPADLTRSRPPPGRAPLDRAHGDGSPARSLPAAPPLSVPAPCDRRRTVVP
jgi:hypothetical protein